MFYSSSACMYPAYNQEDPDNPNCAEDSAYPAAPDSEYGWEKLFSERLYLAYQPQSRHEKPRRALSQHLRSRRHVARRQGKGAGRDVPQGCRSQNGGTIEMWGDGLQTRSFLYIDECLEGSIRLARSEHEGPFNVGSEEMVTLNQLAAMVMDIAGKKLEIEHIPGPLGVRGRNSDNKLIKSTLGWAPSQPLMAGLEKTYAWIEAQVARKRGVNAKRA